MSLGQKAQDLLRIAEEYRDDHCQALLAKASAEAQAILREAHAAARRDLRAMLNPEHERLATGIAAAEANLVTLRRMHEQQRYLTILGLAWPRLVQALRERWEAPSGRTSWVAHYLSIAFQAFPGKGWLIQYPQDLPAAELEQARLWLQTHGIEEARFEADPGMPAGIRVVCGLNLLDASLEGLLTDRTQIEGRLLHHVEQGP